MGNGEIEWKFPNYDTVIPYHEYVINFYQYLMLLISQLLPPLLLRFQPKFLSMG